jgi:hypothetical protein
MDPVILFVMVIVASLYVLYRQLRGSGRSRYRQMLDSDLWRDRKADYYSRHPKRCAMWGWHWGSIQLHHLRYRGYHPSEALDKDLIPLCEHHHRKVHGR